MFCTVKHWCVHGYARVRLRGEIILCGVRRIGLQLSPSQYEALMLTLNVVRRYLLDSQVPCRNPNRASFQRKLFRELNSVTVDADGFLRYILVELSNTYAHECLRKVNAGRQLEQLFTGAGMRPEQLGILLGDVARSS